MMLGWVCVFKLLLKSFLTNIHN